MRQGHGPSTLVAYTTARCTQQCRFCTGAHQGASIVDLTPSVLGACFDAFPSLDSVCLAGLGEPLLVDALPELIERVTSTGRKASLITNGHLVTRRLAEIAWQKLCHVNVSVNEIDREAYARMTGVDALAAVEDSVECLVEAGVSVIASFVTGHGVHQRIPAFLQWAAEHGVGQVAFVNLLPQISAEGALVDPDGFWRATLTQDDSDYRRLLPGYAEQALRLGIVVQCFPTPISRVHYPHPPLCVSPLESLGVDGEGNVSPCRRLAAPAPRWGNVLRDGSAVWQSPAITALRVAHEEGTTPPMCHACFGSWSG